MNNQGEIKTVVRNKYNEIARTNGSCCGTQPCNVNPEAYDSIKGYDSSADLGLGCGLPTQYAEIQPGDVVVDLGSGAGNDVFIARNEVGPDGRVIGVDFATDMIAKAEANKARLGYANVEFVHGDLEQIPLGAGIADVVVSNCVMNLVPDKIAAYRETYRILKPGGHFSISDIVVQGDIPAPLQQAAELYAGCVSGAIQKEDYLKILSDTGFEEITVRKEDRINLTADTLNQFLTTDQVDALSEAEVGIYSITVNAKKPVDKTCCDSACCAN